MKIINTSEAKAQLSDLVQKVMNGEKVVIAKKNKPIIELQKLDKINQNRVPNLYKNQVKVIGKWKDSDKLVEELMLNSNVNIDESDPH